MKRTQIKDTLRNIWKQKVSFLSIIVIAIMGMTTFLGIEYAATGLKKNGSNLYNLVNYRDIEAASTLLFTEEDFKDIRKVEGIKDAEKVRLVSCSATAGGDYIAVDVISTTERINLPQKVEGELPENNKECALERDAAVSLGLKVGDTIKIVNGAGNKHKYLKNTEYKITGIYTHPDHANKIVKDSPYVFVTYDAFDSEALENCFMKTEIVIDKPENSDFFSDSYKEKVQVVMDRMAVLAETNEKRRDDEVHNKADEKIEEGQKKLDDAKLQLTDARKQLDEKTGELEDGEKQIADAEAKIPEAEKLLAEGWQKLESARKQLEDGKKQLDEGRVKLEDATKQKEDAEKQLADGKKQLEDGYKQIEDGKAQIRDTLKNAVRTLFGSNAVNQINWYPTQSADADDPNLSARYLYITDSIKLDLSVTPKEFIKRIIDSDLIPKRLLTGLYYVAVSRTVPRNLESNEYDYETIKDALAEKGASYFTQFTELSEGCTKWDEAHAQYLDGLRQYNEKLPEYENGVKLFNEAEAKYNAGLKQYQDGLAEYNKKKAEYEQGLKDLEEGKKQAAEGREKLEDGEKQYSDGLNKYNEGKEKLDNAREEIKGVNSCRWLIVDGRGNASYVQMMVGSDNFGKLKMTFSLMFVLVGALVIYATVGKMVDEQRNLIGTTKALGFYNREIFAKYLTFGISATLVGTILGILVARFGIEPFLLGGFDRFYRFDMGESFISVFPTVLVTVLGVLLAIASITFASAKLLREPAVRLMQPKTPASSKKKGGNSKLSLYSRLILLNMRSDLKRVIVTIISVAGCCALIVIGFTLKSAVKSAQDIQFNEITTYDWNVKFNPESSETASQNIEKILKSYGTEYTEAFCANMTYNITHLQIAETYCGNLEKINEFNKLTDRETGKPVDPAGDGIYVQRRMAEVYDLDVGSRFDISLGFEKTTSVRVAGVFENYIGQTIAISSEYFEKVFEEPAVPNTFLVKLNGADANKLTEELKGVSSFEGISMADAGKSLIESSTTMLNTTVILFIVIAAIMAGVVLLNLTNMYILQKKRELTVMRINGFTTKEVINYVLRETIVTTIIGIIIGILAGIGIAYRILRNIEQIFIQLYRTPDPIACGLAIVITIFFTVIVNVIALRKVKHLKLTDVA